MGVLLEPDLKGWTTKLFFKDRGDFRPPLIRLRSEASCGAKGDEERSEMQIGLSEIWPQGLGKVLPAVASILACKKRVWVGHRTLESEMVVSL